MPQPRPFAVGAIATPTTADARWGWWGPALLGGFAAGAIIGSAFARPYYYGYGYGYPAYGYGGYYAPAYYGGYYPARVLLRAEALLRLLALARRLPLSRVLNESSADSQIPMPARLRAAGFLYLQMAPAVPRRDPNSDKLTSMMPGSLYRGIWLIRG